MFYSSFFFFFSSFVTRFFCYKNLLAVPADGAWPPPTLSQVSAPRPPPPPQPSCPQTLLQPSTLMPEQGPILVGPPTGHGGGRGEGSRGAKPHDALSQDEMGKRQIRMETLFWGGLALPLPPQGSPDRDRHCAAGAWGIPGELSPS